jgi:hypothetical protein
VTPSDLPPASDHTRDLFEALKERLLDHARDLRNEEPRGADEPEEGEPQ